MFVESVAAFRTILLKNRFYDRYRSLLWDVIVVLIRRLSETFLRHEEELEQIIAAELEGEPDQKALSV